jgi:ketosteroid isomerase-like protein
VPVATKTTGDALPAAFDESPLRAAETALERALASADRTAWVYHYTEDAVFVGPGQPVVQGREALLEMAQSMMPLSSVSIVPVRTEASGNVAAVYGHGSWVNGAGTTRRAQPTFDSSSFGARSQTEHGASLKSSCTLTQTKRLTRVSLVFDLSRDARPSSRRSNWWIGQSGGTRTHHDFQ